MIKTRTQNLQSEQQNRDSQDEEYQKKLRAGSGKSNKRSNERRIYTQVRNTAPKIVPSTGAQTF